MNKYVRDETAEVELSEKKKRLSRKFKINKESVTLQDILSMIEKMKFEKLFSPDTANKIFSELDPNNTGVVKTDDFIEHIVNRKTLNFEDDLDIFCRKMSLELVSKSEMIRSKLKKIREKAWIANDKESIEDIDWIIVAVGEDNIFEPEYSEFNKKLANKDYMAETGIDYIMKYSQIEDNQRKERDIQAIQTDLQHATGHSSSTRVCPSDKRQFECGLAQVQVQPFTIVNSKIAISKVQDKDMRRRSTSISTLISPSMMARLATQLTRIDGFEFDIFDMDDLVQKKAAVYMAQEIFSSSELLERDIIDENKFKNFINDIVDSYDRDVIYHNDIHGGDVMQTVHVMITQGNLLKKLHLNVYDTFSIVLASLCHDVKHTGQSNSYHINSKSKIAIRYNDISVLENYHLTQTFKILLKPENYFMDNFSPEQYRICRRRMIECILATDMANHQKYLSTLKGKGETYEIKKGANFEKMFTSDNNLSKIFENQQCVLNMCVHTADISNPGKPYKISDTWTNKVYSEFFVQGELEKKKGLPVSLLCDRETTNVNKAMIGFINFIVAPTFEALLNFIPEIYVYNDYLKSNLKRYELALKKEESMTKK